MPYNATKMKEQESIKPGVLVQAVIVGVRDGKVSDFISDEAQAKWNNPTQTAIEVTAECQHNAETYRDTRIFPYKNDAEGNTCFTGKSNLGKYKRYYGKLPEPGDRVQMKTNADGYFKLLIE